MAETSWFQPKIALRAENYLFPPIYRKRMILPNCFGCYNGRYFGRKPFWSHTNSMYCLSANLGYFLASFGETLYFGRNANSKYSAEIVYFDRNKAILSAEIIVSAEMPKEGIKTVSVAEYSAGTELKLYSVVLYHLIQWLLWLFFQLWQIMSKVYKGHDYEDWWNGVHVQIGIE